MAQANTVAALLAALQAIVLECMDYPPVRPYSSDSYLPEHLLDAAKQAIQTAGGTAAANTTKVRA